MRLVGVVVMVFVIVFFFMIFVVTAVMCFEQRTFPELQFDRAICFQKCSHRGIRCERFNRISQPWRQIGSNPKHKIGVLQRGGLRRAQAIFVRACTGLNNQIRRADSIHDPRHQGMDGGNIHSDLRRVRVGAPPHQSDSKGQGKKFSGH